MESNRLSMIARSPLLAYFVLVLGFFIFTLLVLSIDTGFQQSWEYLTNFIKNNILAVSSFLAGVFILVLTISSLKYKEDLNLSSKDYALWLEQRATKTSLPIFSRLHDKLRLKFRPYRNWHTRSYSDSLNYLLVIVFAVVFVANNFGAGNKILLADIPTIEPPSDAPIMNAPSDVTNGSIRWNITDNNTNEDDHTFQRTDHFVVGTVPSTTKLTIGTPYSYNETGLSPNVSYTRHAHATNDLGESPASSNATAVTLANTPGVLAFLSVTTTTITVLVDTNSNPGSTEFAIQETSTSKFIQSNGSLSDAVAWNTYTLWGGDSGKITTGLSVNTDYTFRIKARNSDNIETSYSLSSSKTTHAKTPTSPALTVVSTTSIRVVINDNGNPPTVEYVILNETGGKYVTSSGELSSVPDWNTKANYGGAGGVLNTGLSEKTNYTYKVKARNNDNVETSYSVGNTVNTGSPGSSSGGGEGGGSGGGSANNNNDQYTVEINVLDADPGSGDYLVGVNYLTKGGLLIGNLEGSLNGNAVTGSFVGEFSDTEVSGVFGGRVNSGVLSEAIIVLIGKDDPDFGETLLVKGVFERAEKENVVGGQINYEVNDIVNNTTAALALITALTAIPAIASSIIAQVISSAGSFQWLFLGYVPKRRRRIWGQVLDSDTHAPVAGVRVELTSLKDSKIIKRLMTDKTGRYGFLVESPGSYTVAIHSPLYLDYQSQAILITDPKLEIVGQDILLKPNEEEIGKRVVRAARIMQLFKVIAFLHWPLLIGGTILSVYLEAVEPSPLRAAVVAIYSILWVYEISQLARRHSYGTVVGKETKEGQSNAIVQLVRDREGVSSIAATTITDKHGRFFFVVRRANYNLSATKSGYIPTFTKFNGETPDTILEISKKI